MAPKRLKSHEAEKFPGFALFRRRRLFSREREKVNARNAVE
jgi:hypothetical protein